jgi:hypothetical protein
LDAVEDRIAEITSRWVHFITDAEKGRRKDRNN